MSVPEPPPERGWRAWISKAENDFLCIENNLVASRIPWDAVAFHAQQGSEKLLKAFLIHRSRQPPRTHDLVSILALCVQFEPVLSSFEPDCERLTVHGVRSRYPDDREEITEADARALVAGARRIRAAVLPLLH